MTRKPSAASVFAISKISEITLPLSLINLFLTYAVWLEEIGKGNIFFIPVKWPLSYFISLPFFQHINHSLFLIPGSEILANTLK